MRVLLCAVIFAAGARTCPGWWESGHHLIALMAFDDLSTADQQRLVTLLHSHPRFADDFRPPEGIQNGMRWQIGRTGYWPDVARGQPAFDRPNWHFQLGASLAIGENLDVPKTPGPLPDSADLESPDLHIAQAFQLCRAVMADENQSPANRAIAICWLAHLAGDSHQPCHAGSLYFEKVFPKGDRGANSIPTKQHENLHAFWDSLHGPVFDEADVERQIREIRSDAVIWNDAQTTSASFEDDRILQWLTESRKASVAAVYTPVVLNAVRAAQRSGTELVETIDLPPDYIQHASRIAQRRAAFAAHRLARVWRECLN